MTLRWLAAGTVTLAILFLAGCATPGPTANTRPLVAAAGGGTLTLPVVATHTPTSTIAPTETPTTTPTHTPSPTPSSTPTHTPTVTPTAIPTATATPTPSATPTPTPDPAAFINGLAVDEFLVMSPETEAHVREILARGRELGRNPHAFSKLGDSLSLIAYFFVWFDQNRYDLGIYDALQPAIDHYRGSFQRYGMAVRNGLHAWAAHRPGNADPLLCDEEESMVACEIRIHNPSVLLIRLGTNDTAESDAFERALRYTVEYAAAEGIVPVLATKADRFEGPDNRNNRTIRRVAADLNVPLWDFDRLAGTLPGRGLGADNVHLTAAASNDFTDPVTLERGFPVNDLSGLFVLDRIRQLALEVDE